MVNIDIISGFLGAGKTTFANMLLKYYINSGLRPVYIVNEFGKTGLDAEIIKADGFEAVEIEGGFICCTLKNDIGVAMAKVIEAFSPDNIIFEPSGIFIFDNFTDVLKQPQLRGKCEIKNIFTVVDSVNFNNAKAIYGSFIYNQIKNAPVIILSKLEKTDTSVDEVICDIKNINPNALIFSKIFNEWDNLDFTALLNKYREPEVNYRSHGHIKFKTLSIAAKGDFSQERVNDLALKCSQGVFGDICRVKGVVMVDGVYMLINISFNDVTISKFNGVTERSLTFIGDSINKKNIVDFIGV